MKVTKTEIAQAKQYDVLSYLRLADPAELIKISNSEHRLKSHDSFKISNGMWHWFSKGIGGRSAIDYLIKVKNYSFPQAVFEINRTMKGVTPSFFSEKEAKSSFKLPERNQDSNIAINYLLQRGICKSLIDKLITNGTIYESKQHHSVVFVGANLEGKPAHASYRATNGSNCKGDFKSSDKRFCFRNENPQSVSVHVYEGAIDLLSYLSLCIMFELNYEMESYISLAGIHTGDGTNYKLPLALNSYLERNKTTQRIVLHFDNDQAGMGAMKAIKEKLKEQYKVEIRPAKRGKDYNEYLQIIRREKKNGSV